MVARTIVFSDIVARKRSTTSSVRQSELGTRFIKLKDAWNSRRDDVKNRMIIDGLITRVRAMLAKYDITH